MAKNMNKTFTLKLTDGRRVRVALHAEFTHYVGGDAFNFVVTDAYGGAHKVLTHRESGKRVADLGVGLAWAAKFRAAKSDTARGRVVLESLVERHGERCVHSVLAAAV